MKSSDQPSGQDIRINGEFVLCDSDIAYRAHRALFKFEQDRYILCESSPLSCLETIRTGFGKLHLACQWKGMLSLTLWRDLIDIGDVLQILKSIGMNDRDLRPFLTAEVDDLFPALYYGKHFDVLRRICNQTKAVAESKLRSKVIKVDCHLIAEDSQQIVASSL